MKNKVPLPAVLVIGATMLATVGVGLYVLREDPPPPPPPKPASRPQPPTPAPPPLGPALAPSPPGVRPCKVAHDGDGPVAAACRSGGHEEARRFMKGVVDRAKGRAERVTCDGCHDNLDDYALQEGARAKLADLLASLGEQRPP
jgi:hypothetical protein